MTPARRYLTPDDVALLLGVSSRSLRRLVAEVGEACPPPLVDVGTGSRPTWRWDSGRIDRWLQEVTVWRASRSAATGGRSGGATPTGPSATAPAPTRAQRRRSRETSSEESPSVTAGSLLTFARALASEKR